MPRVIIIGAGPSGLVAAKEALEAGLEPCIYEKADSIGGLWAPGSGSTWEGMRTNLSKFSCMFSDAPWPKTTDLFPCGAELYQYLKGYVEKFKLGPYIQCNSEVTHLEKNGSGWQVTHQKKSANSNITENFEFVIVASGAFSESYIPQMAGLNVFQGIKLHSSQYKSPTLTFTQNQNIKKRRVAIIGNAFSGTEIAAGFAENGADVVHIFKNPRWIIPRFIPSHNGNKLPIDWVFYNHATRKQTVELKFKTEAQHRASNTYMASLCIEQNDPEGALYISPDSSMPTQIAISDTYINLVKARKIQPRKASIKQFDETGVIFSDDSRMDVDVLVFATGYKINLKFLDKSIQKLLKYDYDDQFQPLLLYKCILPDLDNMAFVGVYRGSYFSIIELQARWAALLFSQQLPAPAQHLLVEALKDEQSIRELNPRPQYPHGDYMGLACNIADELGCLPNFELLNKEYPELYKAIWSGLFFPVHFRLFGPGNKPDCLEDQLLEVTELLNLYSHSQAPELNNLDCLKLKQQLRDFSTKSLAYVTASSVQKVGMIPTSQSQSSTAASSSNKSLLWNYKAAGLAAAAVTTPAYHSGRLKDPGSRLSPSSNFTSNFNR